APPAVSPLGGASRQDLRHRRDERGPGLRLLPQLPPARRRNRVVLGLPVVLRHAPLARHPPPRRQPMQRRIERALLHTQRVVAHPLQPPRHVIPVHRMPRERPQHHHVQRAAQEIELHDDATPQRVSMGANLRPDRPPRKLTPFPRCRLLSLFRPWRAPKSPRPKSSPMNRPSSCRSAPNASPSSSASTKPKTTSASPSTPHSAAARRWITSCSPAHPDSAKPRSPSSSPAN